MALKGEAKAAYMAKYRAAHKSLRRTRAKIAREERPFIGIDSEGVSFGESVKIGTGDLAQCQRTIFWGAGNAEGDHTFLDGSPYCSSEGILEWLLDLKDRYGDAIFVWFGSSYDATQLFVDLPYKKAFELQHGRPFDRPDMKPRLGRYVLWRGYALSYIKQKCLKISRLRDPRNPRNKKTGHFDFSATITLYDVFGFFQTSFLKAARSIPGCMCKEDEAIIEDGKKSRSNFELGNRAEMQRYTAAELRVLARMMHALRDSLETFDIKLQRWQGAGSIAGALLKSHAAKEHFYAVASKDIGTAQDWAHHAFFGGRIECLQQGRTEKPLYQVDVRSAYPFHMSRLPSMKGGIYREIENPDLDLLAETNCLSMFMVDFEVKVSHDPHTLNKIDGIDGPEFYPLPYRDNRGRITFPPRVRGIYMAEEVRSALEWCRTYEKIYSSKARNPTILSIRFRLEKALIFERGNDEFPFEWLRDMYNERREIVARNEKAGTYDLTEKVIKLGINSVYGKTSQSVGSNDRPPSTACPWYAAAITAGTRAQLLRAALHAPGGIVSFQTDGIVSTKRLGLSEGRSLGQWECETLKGRSIFVQPGVYHLGEKSKHRGIKADLLGTDNFEEWLVEQTDKWAGDGGSAPYPYRYYMTLGAAVASEERWKSAGWWVDGTRELQLDNLGFKRAVPISAAARRKRATGLVKSIPKPAFYHEKIDGEFPLSSPHAPDWLDTDQAMANELELLNEEISFTNP